MKFPGSLDIFKKLITEDYLQYKTNIKPVVYKMDRDYVKYALEVFEYFGHFGYGFNKIKFAYTGKLMMIDGQFLYLNDFKFRSYTNTKKFIEGKTYQVIFNIDLGYKDSIYFTISEIKEIADV